MKCGTEDYEILRKLAETDPAAADRICRKALYAFDDYVTDPALFEDIHTELIQTYTESAGVHNPMTIQILR